VVDFSRSPPVAVGDRVRLLQMHLDPSPVPPGALGTVWLIDAMGTVHVQWDDGRELGLVPEIDRYERVEPAASGPGAGSVKAGGEPEPTPRLVGGQPLSVRGLTPAQLEACRAIARRPGHVHFTAHPDLLALGGPVQGARPVLVFWREGEGRRRATITVKGEIEEEKAAD
jgi:hypothetical protein